MVDEDGGFLVMEDVSLEDLAASGSVLWYRFICLIRLALQGNSAPQAWHRRAPSSSEAVILLMIVSEVTKCSSLICWRMVSFVGAALLHSRHLKGVSCTLSWRSFI